MSSIQLYHTGHLHHTIKEALEVERPLLLQLAGIGAYMLGHIDVPELTERENFRQIALNG